MRKVYEFNVLIERIPMFTPIGIIWDKTDSNCTFGLVIFIWIIGVQYEKKRDDIL